MQGGRRLPGDQHHRQGPRAPDGDAPLAALRGLDRVDLGRLGDRLDRAEVLADQPERVGRRHVADDDRDRVAGTVVGPVVLIDGVSGHVLDVAPPADHRPAVRMSLEGRRHHGLPQEPPGAVLAPLQLAPHHGHLGVQVRLVDPAVHHPVGLDPHRELESVGRDRRVVVRPVVVRARVERGAVEEQGPGDLAEPVLPRALEEHVLEQVGDPGDPGVLVAGPGTVPDAEADDRRAPDLLDEHGEAVRQHGLLDARGQCRRGGRSGRGGPARGAADGPQETEEGQEGGQSQSRTAGLAGDGAGSPLQYRASRRVRAGPPPPEPAEAGRSVVS